MTAIKADAAARRLDHPDPAIRLYLFHGPDESGSRVLADRVGKAAGAGAERIDVTGSQLKADPALLADEAAAISLFGGPRWIRIEQAGEETLNAVTALLELPAAGNPAVMIAGNLRKDSKLLALATRSPHALAVVSYLPDAGGLDRMAQAAAREAGLEMTPDVARRLARAAGSDRMVLAQEIEKLALFLDAAPDRRREAGHDALDALLADASEGSLGLLVDAALDGRADAADAELQRLATDGIVGVPVLLAIERRLVLLALLRAEVDGGNAPARVVEQAGGRIFWKDRETVTRQLSRWTGAALAQAMTRLLSAKRQTMRAAGPGALGAEAEVLALARFAARLRR